MPAYTYEVDSWAGSSFAGSNYTVWFERENGPMETRPVQGRMSNIIGKGPVDVGGQPGPRDWDLHVQLTAINQSDLDALHDLFNEEEGVQYLRIVDGDGTAWRVVARVVEILPGPGANRFIVHLSVPQPVFEEDTLQTSNALDTVGNTKTFNGVGVTNNGNRKGRPQLTIIPDLVKTSCVDDYKYSFRGFIVNRAPLPWINLPVYLFDQSGVAARLSTTTLIKDTTVSNDTVGAITANQTTIPIDTPVGGGLPATGGLAWMDTEQVYYTSISAGNMIGVVRGVGGTTAATHVDNTKVYKSEALSNGDDARVWINDVEYNRWLVGWNSANSDIVINVTMPTRQKKTLAIALTASDTSVTVSEGTSGMDNSGFVVIGTEVIYYAARVGRTLTGCVRGVHGTTAAIHAVNDPVYGRPLLYTVGLGKATADTPPSPTNERPAIQLPASSNQVWRWGDQTNDASTVFYDPSQPDRTAMWSPGFDLDGNDIVPLTRMDNSTGSITFKDDYPGDQYPNYNFLEIELPQGIEAVASGITADWTPAAVVLNLEMFGRDKSGTLKLLDELQQAAAAPARTKTPTATLYGLKLKARYNVIAGYWGTLEDVGSDGDISNTTVHPDSNGTRAQTFVTTRPTIVRAVALYLDADSASQEVYAEIFPTSSDHPVTSSTSNVLQSRFRSSATITTTAGWYVFVAVTPILLLAGTWSIVVYRTGTTSLVTWLGSNDQEYGNGQAWKRVTATVEDWDTLERGDFAFLLLGNYDSRGEAVIEESDAPVGTPSNRTGITASFDKVVLQLNDAVADPQTPLVHRTGGFTNSLYHCSGVVVNSTTGDSYTIDKWMAIGASLVIDSDGRTVTYTENGVEWSVPNVVTPDNSSDWLPMVAGVNVITYSEPNMRQTDLLLQWRGKRA